jgi:hypothetical protein
MANLAAECRQQTESLFVKNHEPFFSAIGHLQKSAEINGTSA